MAITGPWNINKSESQLQRQQGTARDCCDSARKEGDCSINFKQQDRCVPKVAGKSVERLQEK